ncbi:MAG: hypothetical protein EFT35_01135 [Methanophagales archaeon ANME-1-THS]|nr:MAG: hypothetical protein EFT35_01135 [Methanophagales archaeon ANME-1-THS]
MRKGRVIPVLALTAVMLVAMSGTISAMQSVGRSPSELILRSGEKGTFTITAMPDYTTDAGYFGVMISPAQSAFTISVRDGTGTLASGYGSDPVESNTISYSAGTAKTLYVDVTNTGAPEASYSILFSAHDGDKEYTSAWIKAKVTSEIPEFATIAIPVGAIIGLLFFFDHRKHRKA